MLFLDLHNSSHHTYTQPHLIIVKYMKYLRLNMVLNRRENFELVSAMLRRGVEKSLHDHDRTITLLTINVLLRLIRRDDFSNFAD